MTKKFNILQNYHAITINNWYLLTEMWKNFVSWFFIIQDWYLVTFHSFTSKNTKNNAKNNQNYPSAVNPICPPNRTQITFSTHVIVFCQIDGSCTHHCNRMSMKIHKINKRMMPYTVERILQILIYKWVTFLHYPSRTLLKFNK